MKRSTKIILITAVCLIVAGTAVCFAAPAFFDFEFDNLLAHGTVKVYEPGDGFDRIEVYTAESDILLMPSEDGICRVRCRESEKLFHTVSVSGGALVIEQKDTREWYDMIGFLSPETDITVYLPENVYESLILSSKSGKITVPDGFTFGSAGVSALSGDVRFEADTKGLLEAETSSGSLTVRGTEADKMNLGTVSGDLHVDSARASELIASALSGEIEISASGFGSLGVSITSGDISMSDTVVDGDLSAVSTSGDVKLFGCDAKSLLIKTVSGDASGTLLSEKVFITETSSGRVNVPETLSGGKCKIITTSGDIDFDIKNQ